MQLTMDEVSSEHVLAFKKYRVVPYYVAYYYYASLEIIQFIFAHQAFWMMVSKR